MDAVKSCLSRYINFCIAGYSEASTAVKAMQYIPGTDILGFAYLHDMIRSRDVDALINIVNKANILFQDIVDPDNDETKIPFIFLLSSKIGGMSSTVSYISAILENVAHSNLSIGYYDYNVVTDIVIKVQMFGTILLKRRPFEVEKSKISETMNNVKHLSIELPFIDKYVEIFHPLTIIETDKYLVKFSAEKILCMIRTYMYLKSGELLSNIEAAIYTLPYEEKILYESILRNIDIVGG